jgi:hypothetical protein
VNTPPENNKPSVGIDPHGQQIKDRVLPEFLLSPVSPCTVELVPDAVLQTQPSRTEAELMADGQCEV